MQVNTTQEGLVLHLLISQPSYVVLNDSLKPKIWQVAICFVFVICLVSLGDINIWYLEMFWLQ